MSKQDTDAETESHDAIEPVDGNVVRPTARTEEDTVSDSPVEKIKRRLPDHAIRKWNNASDDHPLAQTAGTTGAIISDTPEKVQQLLAKDMYQDPDVFWREWTQNHVAACVREAKRVVKKNYGESALYHEVEHDHPDLHDTRTIQLPQLGRDIIEAAMELGYEPQIEIRLNKPERKLTTRDNGIGMTTGEVIDVWNEPVESGSALDLSSAGNKGIGALTYRTIVGDDGALGCVTRTRREETIHTNEPVPQRDRDGFRFFSALGSIIPIKGDIPDGFYGTEFELPVKKDINLGRFKSALEDVCQIQPVPVLFEIVDDGESDTEEYPRTTFFGRYDQEPRIQIDRPGEFSVAMDSAGVVEKTHSSDDFFLLDLPIDRSTPYHLDVDGVWNEHIQIHNEQGLIIDGPNRGRLQRHVEELHDDDVPLPQPVASRDSLKQDEAQERFFTYIDNLAQEQELEHAREFIESLFMAYDQDEAFEFCVQQATMVGLVYQIVSTHGSSRDVRKPKKFLQFVDETDKFSISVDAPRRAVTSVPSYYDLSRHKGIDYVTRDLYGKDAVTRYNDEYSRYYRIAEVFTNILRNGVSYAEPDARGDPDLKENRSIDKLWELLCKGDYDHEQIFVGKSLHSDRVEVIHNTYPDALVLKPEKSYRYWQSSPLNARLVKNVPLTRDDEGADEFEIPNDIHDRHTSDADDGSSDGTTKTGNQWLKIRTTQNASVDKRMTVDELLDNLDDCDFGEIIPNLANRYLVVFPDNADENISDYYDLSAVCATLRASATVSERLLEHEQVFRMRNFFDYMARTPQWTYDPWDETWERRTLHETHKWLLDSRTRATRAYHIRPGESTLWNLILNIPHGDYDYRQDSWSDYRDDLVDSIWEHEISSASSPTTSNPANGWLAVLNEEDGHLKKRIKTYIWLDKHYEAFGASANVNYVDNACTLRLEERSYLDIGTNTIRNFRKRKKRVGFNGLWDVTSDAWRRIDIKDDSPLRSYRGGLTDTEMAIYRALREHGIDPWEHTPQQMETALLHLLDC